MTTTTRSTQILVFTNPDYGPCRQMTKTVNQLETEHPGFEIEPVDVWQNPDKAVQHDVMTVPTTVILVDGEERARLNGLRSPHALRREIDRIAETEVTSTYRSPLLSRSRRLSKSAQLQRGDRTIA